MDNIAESVRNFTIELNKKLSEAEALEKKLAYFTETASIGIYDNNCITRLDDVLDYKLISGWMGTIKELIEKLQKAKSDEILIMIGQKQQEPIAKEPKTVQIVEKETETIKSSPDDKKTLKNENKRSQISEEIIKQIQDAYTAGESKNGISKRLGIAYNTVDKYTHKIKRPIQPIAEEKENTKSEEKEDSKSFSVEDVIKYYTKDYSHTLKDTADHFNTDKKTMHAFIVKNGLERPSYSGM